MFSFFHLCFFFRSLLHAWNAWKISLAERCTSCASSASSPLSAAPFSWTTPGSGFAGDQLSVSLLVMIVVWMERSTYGRKNGMERFSLHYSHLFCYLSKKKLCSDCLAGCCRRSIPHPWWPGCLGNSVSWFPLMCWIWSMVRLWPGWESTTALCCLW